MKSLPAAIVTALALTACGPRPQNADSFPDTLSVDHIILAIDSLERGIDLLEELTGVRPVFGGVHPGRGTQNALLSLGQGRYLELLAPNPDDTTESARQRLTASAGWFETVRTPTPSGWAMQVPDALFEYHRLVMQGLPASQPQAGSRARPDGRTLAWHTLNPWGDATRFNLPFVIAWDPHSPHPWTDAPAGCQLVSLEVHTPNVDSTRALFERAGWSVPVRLSATEQLEFLLDCPTGRVRFPE